MDNINEELEYYRKKAEKCKDKFQLKLFCIHLPIKHGNSEISQFNHSTVITNISILTPVRLSLKPQVQLCIDGRESIIFDAFYSIHTKNLIAGLMDEYPFSYAFNKDYFDGVTINKSVQFKFIVPTPGIDTAVVLHSKQSIKL